MDNGANIANLYRCRIVSTLRRAKGANRKLPAEGLKGLEVVRLRIYNRPVLQPSNFRSVAAIATLDTPPISPQLCASSCWPIEPTTTIH